MFALLGEQINKGWPFFFILTILFCVTESEFHLCLGRDSSFPLGSTTHSVTFHNNYVLERHIL
jgi:hypothetical protein